jgi:hypothetical protein
MLAGVAGLAAVAIIATGCGGAAKPAAENEPVHKTTPAPAPTTPSPAPPTGPALFTGQPGPDGPVVGIKVDNISSAWPLQTGLGKADIVYQILVEGGLTRFLALYVGPQQVEVGPSRSARDSDIQLLAQYGRIVFGFSGAAAGTLSRVQHGDLIVRPQELYGSAYTIKGRRPVAYNMYTSPARLLALNTAGATDPRDVGFRFGPLPAGVGRPVSTVRVAWPSAEDTLTWSNGGWQISQSGRPLSSLDGDVPHPATVIVQAVPVGTAPPEDASGQPAPRMITVGSGPAWIYRDGRELQATWQRPNDGSPTHYVDSAGHDVPLAPGQLWVLLVGSGTTPAAS